MIKKILDNKFYLIVIFTSITLSLWTVYPWLFSNKILYFWDAYIPFDPINSFEHLFYHWSDGLFPGYPTTGWSWLIYWGLFFLPFPLTNSLPISEAFVYVFLLVFSVLNFYLLCSYVLEKLVLFKENKILIRSTALITAILYTFNTYTFSNFYFMFNPGTFILAFLPLNILALAKIYPLDKKVGKDKKKILWIFIFFISLLSMSPGFGVYVFLLQYFVWVFIYLFLYWFLAIKKIWSRVTLELLLFFTLIIFGNLWWLAPAILGIENAYSGQSSFGTSVWFDNGFKPSQLLNAIRLLGSGLMINNKFSWSILYEENSLFTFPLFIFPFLFVWALAFLKKKLSVILIFFLGMTLVSLFIVKFSNPPFAWILGFAYHYIPFFGGFRDAFQKAGVYFIQGYFIFIAIGLSSVIQILIKKKLKFFLYFFIIFFFAASIIITGPFFFFTGNNVREISFIFNNKAHIFSARTQIPPEYYSLKRFIEDKCQGETIASVPRSGFVTDAVWSKYSSSYVGQDMLEGLINCNFLSTAMFNSYAESNIQAPYLQLQQGDFNTFKYFLKQNGIRYVLVRHDYVPQGFVTWAYVDPNKIEKFLANDRQFSKIFGNEFLSLYETKDQPGSRYGFNATDNVVHLGSDIKSPTDFAIASEMIGDSYLPVIPNSTEDREKYRGATKTFISIANCIGCELNPEAKYKISPNFIQDFKEFIKSIIPRRDRLISSDIQISSRTIEADNIFKKLIQSAEEKNQKAFDSSLSKYKSKWEEVERLISGFHSDKFTVNGKYIEVTNFLTLQKNTLYHYFAPQFLVSNSFLNKPNNKQSTLSLLSFQNKLLEQFSRNILRTDFDKRIYRLRLDIPQDAEYLCQLHNLKNNLKISSVSVNDKNLANPTLESKMQLKLNKGSYSVDISYQPLEISSQSSRRVDESDEILIGKLDPGAYRVNLRLNKESDGRIVIAVTKGKKSNEILKYIESIDKPGESILFTDQINKDTGTVFDYSKSFQVELPNFDDYYLYLFYLDSLNHQLEVSDIRIISEVGREDIKFACGKKIEKEDSGSSILSVEKKSPTYYVLTLPKEYNKFLVFNQTFDPEWIAYEKGTNKEFTHFISGHGNAWYIDNLKNREIIVEYKKQSFSEKNAIATLTVFALLVIIYFGIKRWD